MRLVSLLNSALLAGTALAGRSWQHVGKQDPERLAQRAPLRTERGTRLSYGGPARDNKIVQNNKTASFKVDGSALPFVDFDVGESYAGLLPISDKGNVSELFFWFFPSDNPSADDEILIWLNGGPGCSSLEGLLQENGPFLWQYGTYRPVPNLYTWVNLTNVVWVEYPPGTGFSPENGTPRAKNEIDASAQFIGFWKNFVETFSLQNRKVYITGESYAGFYVPYIADAMHNQSDTEYYGITGISFNDPVLSYTSVQDTIPSYPMVEYWAPMFSLNDTFMEHLAEKHQSCGFADYMAEAMTFPPNGPLPDPPSHSAPGCNLHTQVAEAAFAKNPCWDIYDITTTCPNLWDVLGFPGSFDYEPAPWVYFNRPDVKRAINAPVTHQWAECQGPVLRPDYSEPSAFTVLPRVIEKNSGRTVINHGNADFILLLNGTIMTIQGMTWNGAQGFSTPPTEWNEFYVPYHPTGPKGDYAGAGVFGNWWEERGFTFCTVDLSGHMIPQYAPSAAYRQVEYLLGRIDSLSDVSDFSTQTGNYGNTAAQQKNVTKGGDVSGIYDGVYKHRAHRR